MGIVNRRYDRFRIAIVLGGYENISDWCQSNRLPISNFLRVIKAKPEKDGRVPRSEGMMLKADDFIREQFSKRSDLLLPSVRLAGETSPTLSPEAQP